MNKFMKADNEKIRVSLVDPRFIEAVGEVLTFGAKKYAADNWKLLPYNELYRIKDSTMRHLLAYLDGEYIDEESGLTHLQHLACNVMFLNYHEEKKIQEDLYEN